GSTAGACAPRWPSSRPSTGSRSTASPTRRPAARWSRPMGAERPYVLRERHAVATFEPEDAGHNTLVLGGLDVVVPLELDVDADPLSDDVVSLRSVHGLFEQTLSAGDPDVTPDLEAGVASYRFRLVPPGLYR